MVKLTDKKIKWAVKQVINKGENTAMVAVIYGISARRIQQLVTSYKETGEYPVLDRERRPRTPPGDGEKRNNPQTNGKIERWFQEYRRLR